jgi:hypothetical protein
LKRWPWTCEGLQALFQKGWRQEKYFDSPPQKSRASKEYFLEKGGESTFYVLVFDHVLRLVDLFNKEKEKKKGEKTPPFRDHLRGREI